MTTVQQQARALGDPTRHGIFRYIADARRPVAVAELTEHFGVNHNAIRQHLAKLLEAGLVTESQVRAGGPGRPRLVYEVGPEAEGRWGAVGPYERLSKLLAEAIRTGDSPEEVGRRAGQLARGGGDAPDVVFANIVDVMARLGFAPELRRRGSRADLVLDACPFASAALADPDIVCALHRGLATGLADGRGVVVDELVAKDPRRAKCRLRLHVESS